MFNFLQITSTVSLSDTEIPFATALGTSCAFVVCEARFVFYFKVTKHAISYFLTYLLPRRSRFNIYHPNLFSYRNQLLLWITTTHLLTHLDSVIVGEFFGGLFRFFYGIAYVISYVR